MSKMKLLLDVVEGMRSLADSIQAAAEAMVGNEPAEQTTHESQVSATEGKPQEKAVTLEQVRAVLAEKSQAGLGAQVRSLLEKHGGVKLSQISQANYAALLADAEELK